MMEASDVTGELRLCMQVIATAGMEQTRYGTNLLERENRFKELMQMFDRLDQIVYRYRNGLQKKEDAVFLKEQGITDTALLIALRIPGDDAARPEGTVCTDYGRQKSTGWHHRRYRYCVSSHNFQKSFWDKR